MKFPSQIRSQLVNKFKMKTKEFWEEAKYFHFLDELFK